MKKITGYLAALLLFLLPLKFGALAVMPESGGYYPEYFIDWLFIPNWHPHALAYFGAFLLALAMIVNREKLARRTLLFLLCWCILPPLAVLPGMIRGDWLIAQGELSLLFGCGSVVAAVVLLLDKEPEKKDFYISAVLLGCAATAAYGWYQHLVTLDELRQSVAAQEAAGIPVSEGMKLKLTDPRIYSTMASSNILASLLMIAVPIAVYCAAKWSRFINPPRSGKIFFLVFFGLLFLSVLILTRSRSVVACPVAAGLIAIFSTSKIKLRWKIAGLATGIAVVVAGIIFFARTGRGVESIGERADYWRTCAILCKEYPLAGAGWGEFFHTHMQIKVSNVDESARDPHNIVAAFAAQCGIPMGLVMLAVLLYPLVLLWKHRFEQNLPCAVFWSGVIFTLHSLIDCDWQSPAMIAVMGVLYACALIRPDMENENVKPLPAYIHNGILALCAACGVVISYFYLAGDYALSQLQDKVNPPSVEIHAAMGRYTVEELVANAAEYRPGSAVIYMYAGDWYLQHRNLFQAEKYFLQALEVAPSRPGAYARLAQIELLRGNREKAEALQLEAHRLFPKSPDYTIESLYRKP